MLKIFEMHSGGASATKFLLQKDPNCGKKYRFVGFLTNSKKGLDSSRYLRDKTGITPHFKSYFEFKKSFQDLSEERIRDKYFEWISDLIEKYNPNYILLAGFMMIIPDSFIVKYRNKIINVHPADLRVMEGEKRKYTGDKSVELALSAGEKYLYSTIHYVNEIVDGGEIICVSPRFEANRFQTPEWNQEQMKEKCDGPAYVEALKILRAKGEIPYAPSVGTQ